MSYSIDIDLRPVSWQHAYNHRAFGRGKMVKFMTPKAKGYKEKVQTLWKEKYGDECIFSDVKLKATVTLQLKGKRKLDIDNTTKLIFDSLNELAYDDDSQIEELHIFKSHMHDTDLVRVEFDTL